MLDKSHKDRWYKTFNLSTSSFAILPITIYCLLFTINLRSEWQWTKETGWVNVKKIRLGRSGKLNEEGLKLLKQGKCADAAQYFIGAYRTSKSEKFSQKVMINLAKAWICSNKNYRAYSVMELFTQKYPHSPYLDEIIKLQYEIGFNFLKGAKREIWGISILPAKSIGHNIIQKLMEKYPFSQYTKENIMKYANFLYSNKEYSMASTYYKKYVELYPEDEYASFAVVRMFHSKQNHTKGQPYDKTNLDEMETELTKLYFKNTKTDIMDKQAYKQLKDNTDNLKAKSDFDVAMYYVRTGKKNAAITYLQTIIEEYPQSIYAKYAKEQLDKINNKK